MFCDFSDTLRLLVWLSTKLSVRPQNSEVIKDMEKRASKKVIYALFAP